MQNPPILRDGLENADLLLSQLALSGLAPHHQRVSQHSSLYVFITLISIIKFIVIFTVDETGNLNPVLSSIP